MISDESAEDDADETHTFIQHVRVQRGSHGLHCPSLHSHVTRPIECDHRVE
jgi:hypothetical protein